MISESTPAINRERIPAATERHAISLKGVNGVDPSARLATKVGVASQRLAGSADVAMH